MDKLTMAHEWAMNSFDAAFENEEERVKLAWRYADAMQAEAEKREDKSRPDVLQEWQPDWDVAPDWAEWWFMDENKACWWSKQKPYFLNSQVSKIIINNSNERSRPFDYQGKWQDSLRKRP